MNKEELEDRITTVLAKIVVFVINMFLVGWCFGVLLGITLSFSQTFAVMLLAKVLSDKPLLD